jgi:dienelactone hydrolase
MPHLVRPAAHAHRPLAPVTSAGGLVRHVATTRTVMVRLMCVGALVGMAACVGDGAPASVTGSSGPSAPSALVTTEAPQAQAPVRETRDLVTPEGRIRFSLHRPAAIDGPRPLVVVAHGFWRSRRQMEGWGAHLASEGYVVAVPDLPGWVNHPRNARAINHLLDSLLAQPPEGLAFDRRRLAFVGFSSGGLATLLAAADKPRVAVWIGLDPVDRSERGVAAARQVKTHAVILQADPSPCNARGNAQAIIDAFGSRVQVYRIAGASHVDAEWPTTAFARLTCGGAEDGRRHVFVETTTSALKTHLR